MRRTTILIFTVFLASSCVTNRLSNKEGCSSYFDVIATEWKRSEQGIYSYSNHPKYWIPHSNFFNGKCLEGMSKAQIITLLGTPSKSFFLKGKEVIIYCTDEKCLYGGLEFNRGLTVTIANESKQVTGAYHNPSRTDREF
jgi:hypothetical protein